MPTRKTVKNTKTTAPKTPIRKTSTKTATVRQSKTKDKMSLVTLRNKVMAPQNRRSLWIAVVIIILVLIIFFFKGLVIAAVVNGQPVSRISIIHDLETQNGKSALDAVVTRLLVVQEANKKHITVTDKEVNNEVAKIDNQFKSQRQSLAQLLASQGISKSKFLDEVRIQLLVTKILGNSVKVSDKEFNDFLAKNQSLIANEKDQTAAKANLRQQLEQQKLAQQYQTWIANVKKNAHILYFVNY